MGNDNDFRKLVELIFITKPVTKEEIVSPYSSLPACLQANDFYPKLRYVLFVRQLIISCRWQPFLENIYKTLESHQLHVTSLMKFFLEEHACNLNVFDSFLSVCSLANLFRVETLQRMGVDFSDLYPDIMMEFYQVTLKKFFFKRGGFQGFAEYIRRHKFLSYKWDRHDLILSESDGPNSPVNKETIDNLKKELKKEIEYYYSIKINRTAVNLSSLNMALKVLSTTSVQLPTLPSYSDLTKKAVECKRSEKQKNEDKINLLKTAAELEVLENIWGEFLNSDPDPAVQQDVKENEEFSHYESIIQAVIRHNCSKSSDLINLNHPILKEADKALEYLKDTIEFIIKVLDDYDKDKSF